MRPGLPPEQYPRRILLAVTGLSPQIVTETLWALAVKHRPPFVPTEIHVITTNEGNDRLTLTLLDPSTDRLRKFAEEWDRPELAEALTTDRIHVITDPKLGRLSDIATEADSASAADCITQVVRGLTADPNAAIHMSIAGGRKTMGVLGGFALSLFGRTQDRLSHVLVNPALEGHPKFFWPPKEPRVLDGRDGRLVSTANARLVLADIAFVRLRHGLPETLLSSGAESYSAAVSEAARGFAPPYLTIDLPGGRVVCGDRAVKLPPRELSLLAWMARRHIAMGGEHGGSIAWLDLDRAALLAEHAQIVGGSRIGANDWPEGSKGTPEDAGRWLLEVKSRVNTRLRDALGGAAVQYQIESFGRRPSTRYRLPLPAGSIEFAPVPARELGESSQD